MLLCATGCTGSNAILAWRVLRVVTDLSRIAAISIHLAFYSLAFASLLHCSLLFRLLQHERMQQRV